MSSNIAIKVDGISKCFESFSSSKDRLNNILFKSEKGKSEFWALKDISFEVNKGETVGIIGRNGAGKSTLLQILCGTLKQSSGNVEINGKVAALLELGAGFNPEFSGRDNIYLNASILGMSKSEIDDVYDSIVEFSELQEFINNPVKSYSSGMYVRLGFAVAAHTNADILIIDEALSVGDVFFQQKCMRFLKSFKEKGGTLLFVSHDTSAVVSMCEKAVMLYPQSKKPCIKGNTEDICKLYTSELYEEKKENFERNLKQEETNNNITYNNIIIGSKQDKELYSVGEFRFDAESFGEQGASISNCYFEVDGKKSNSLEGDQEVSFIIEADINRCIKYPAVGFMIKDAKGQYLYTEGSDSHFRDENLVFNAGEHVKFEFSFNMPILIRGDYTINVAIAEGLGDDHIQHHWIHDALEIKTLKGRVVHGYCGMNNLITKLSWT
ncbi:sugar ABC transporter ATP-binding protein [Photobacterium damselae]|uniref:Sugar ABC transporter ATP-binding protein n=1 Tax=Photobacterium damselae TaxID=38293 RepID=A0ACD3SWE2_PHODM|nr:ABC transporter ATP-binding protein [Photobacterium damselae]RDL31303.1 hypothetical protein BC461_09325 [Photobacterium damselae]TMX50433.1 sugar ABC transporter ATP-binding protein [Photobacterium damselae]TMX66545.1 sugar ABC transporter ATP-binding protein [Photobacterium damselae]TMX70305.1 sugar ABC transporter ATP-binding protein [Photobacterium damselae]